MNFPLKTRKSQKNKFMGGFIEKCAIWHNLYCPDNFTSTFSHYKANTLSHYKANTSYDDTCLINIAMEYVNLVCIHVHVSCLLMPVLCLLFTLPPCCTNYMKRGTNIFKVLMKLLVWLIYTYQYTCTFVLIGKCICLNFIYI